MMISVVNFFRIFDIIIFCFVFAIFDLVHDVEAMYGLPYNKYKQYLEIFSEI